MKFSLLPVKTVSSLCFALAAGFLGLAAETTQAQTFVNGGFETDSWAVGWNAGVFPSGWVTTPSADAIWPYGVHNTVDTTDSYTPFGSQFVALCAARDCPTGVRGSIAQTVSGFVVGAQYELHFQHAPENHPGAVPPEVSMVNVSLAGGTPSSTDFIGQPVGGYFAQWKAQTLVFTANATSVTFTFTGAGTDSNVNSESGIDQVSVTAYSASDNTAVPTLPTVGLALLAIGLLFVAIRGLRAVAIRR